MSNLHSGSVQLQIMSDLHLETPRYMPMYDEFTITPKCPYLALLGDIGSVHDKRLFSFLDAQLLRFRIVFYVLGNHEPYKPDDHGLDGNDLSSTTYTYDTAVSVMESFEAKNAVALASLAEKSTAGETQQDAPELGRLIFLNRRRFDLSSTVTILGATLFSRITEDQRQTTSLFISDFSNIQDWTVDSHNAAHEGDLAWLNDQVEAISRENKSSFEQRKDVGTISSSSCAEERSIVILTHYSPTFSPPANDPEHLEDDRGVQSAFATDLTANPCWQAPCVKVWAFGHTHFNCDFVDEEGSSKRVLANQRGYGREDIFDFDADKVITVE